MSWPRPPIRPPHSLGSVDSGHATMTSHPHISSSSHPHSLTRGPLRATLRPRVLPASNPPSSLTTSHPHSSHKRSHSVDSIRHASRSEATPTNQLYSLSTTHRSPQYSGSQTMASTCGYNSSTRANGGRQSGGSNKENVSVNGRGGQTRGRNLGPLKAGHPGNAPFKDRTNTSQITGREENKSVKGNSLSELTPPLNVARLRPICQSTRTATVSESCWHGSPRDLAPPLQVSITDRRTVVLQFTGRRAQESQTSSGSGEIVEVSQNGMDVSPPPSLSLSLSLYIYIYM